MKKHHEELLKRFNEYGLESFEQDEMLEILLGYVLSDETAGQKAKELLRHLGSVNSVMNMRVEGLIRIAGLSEKCAVLLNIIPKIVRRYRVGNVKTKGETFDTLEKIGEFCTAKYFGATDEVLSMMLLDSKCRFLGYERVQVGSLALAAVNIEKIAQILFAYDASYFVLIHNHPDGELLPSVEDINTTLMVKENLIILEKQCWSIL